MSLLPPAYRGAPYHQPGPPPRRHRVLRRVRLAVIIGTGLLLMVTTGILLTHSSVP
jgi:hypothetical protein